MSKKYPGYNEDDTHSDEYFRTHGMMTNREFFTSNGPGGFYEGLEWDEANEEWVPNAESRQKQAEWDKENRCQYCGYLKSVCLQECDGYPEIDSNDDGW